MARKLPRSELEAVRAISWKLLVTVLSKVFIYIYIYAYLIMGYVGIMETKQETTV